MPVRPPTSKYGLRLLPKIHVRSLKKPNKGWTRSLANGPASHIKASHNACLKSSLATPLSQTKRNQPRLLAGLEGQDSR